MTNKANQSNPTVLRKGRAGPVSRRSRTHQVANWVAAAETFLIDLDGTLIQQAYPLDGAAALLDRLAGRFMIVSNNSADTADALAGRLMAIGLPVTGRQLVLAGEQTIKFLAERHPHCRVMLFASAAMRRMAVNYGLALVDRNADLIVLMRDSSFDYAGLSLAANEIRAGAKLIVSNPDLTHPAPGGQIVVETGALMTALTACADALPARIIGKPEPDLFVEAMRRLAALPDNTIVIGDNPDTDARGAVRLGLRYLLLGPGAGADANSPAALLELPGFGAGANPARPRNTQPERIAADDLSSA
ncbi:MAG: HAD hydrolase-like protein [Pseudolabrys sp.]|nr:HAD hydrolase-like protein [Pseudolabrys sp.]